VSTCQLARPYSAIRLTLIVIMAALLTSCASSQASKKDTERKVFAGRSTEEILRAGDDALQAEEYDRAMFIYMQAIEIEETADTWYRVGITKVRLDDDAFAWKAFNQALQLDPNHAPSLEEMGMLYIGLGEPAEATKVLTQATELDNKRWRAYNGLGVIADIEKRYAEAVVFYKAALDANSSSAMLMNNIGYSYYLAGNLQQAASWFSAAIQADDDYIAAIKNLALLYARQGWYDQAVDTFAKAVDEPEAYNDAGYIAMRNGDLDKATELLTKAIRLSPNYYELAYENLEQVNEQLDELARQTRHSELVENTGSIVYPDGHQQKFRTVLPQTLNVRAQPSPNAEVIEYLRAGNAVQIIASQPGWAFINHGTPSGGTVAGWVNTRFLKGEAAAENNESLDTTEFSEQLSIDSKLESTEPGEQLSIDSKLDSREPDDQLSFAKPDSTKPAEKLIFDEQMNVVAVEVTEAYQTAPAAGTTSAN